MSDLLQEVGRLQSNLEYLARLNAGMDDPSSAAANKAYQHAADALKRIIKENVQCESR